MPSGGETAEPKTSRLAGADSRWLPPQTHYPACLAARWGLGRGRKTLRKLHSPNISKGKCVSEAVRIGSIIIFKQSKLWKAKFSILCYISGEAAGEIWHWSLLGVKGSRSSWFPWHFHSQEWSIPNSCNLTRNIKPHRMKNLRKWRMNLLPILTSSLTHFSLEVFREWNCEFGMKGSRAGWLHSVNPSVSLEIVRVSLVIVRVSLVILRASLVTIRVSVVSWSLASCFPSAQLMLRKCI